jgi:hypothetical protein
MSFEPDNINTDLSVIGLLRQIALQLKLQTEILKEISGLEIKEADLDD